MNDVAIRQGGVSLALYDAMCTAIAACHSVDEVKDVHDRAMALEMYARQSKNTEAEFKACEIRLRAERRAGQLLREMERGQPGPVAKDTVQREPYFKEQREQAGITSLACGPPDDPPPLPHPHPPLPRGSPAPSPAVVESVMLLLAAILYVLTCSLIGLAIKGRTS